LILGINNIEPLVEASGSLFSVHTHDEVAHDSVSLLLHLRFQVLLFTFIFLNLNSKLANLLLVFILSAIQLIDVVQIELLPLFAAHLLPFTESIISKLFVERV